MRRLRTLDRTQLPPYDLRTDVVYSRTWLRLVSNEKVLRWCRVDVIYILKPDGKVDIKEVRVFGPEKKAPSQRLVAERNIEDFHNRSPLYHARGARAGLLSKDTVPPKWRKRLLLLYPIGSYNPTPLQNPDARQVRIPSLTPENPYVTVTGRRFLVNLHEASRV
jgi:hypothetical protein